MRVVGYMLLGIWLGVSAVSSPVSAQPAGPPDQTLFDEEMKLASFVDLAYPPVARSARLQGVVVVRVGLDDEGRVATASAVSGSKTLIPDCLSNARKWRFRPNSRKSAVIVYEFRLDDGACHDDSHSLFRLRHFNFASITACAPVIRG